MQNFLGGKESPLSCPFRDTCAFTTEVVGYLSLIKQNLSVCCRKVYKFISYEFELLSFTNPQHKFGYGLFLGAC